MVKRFKVVVTLLGGEIQARGTDGREMVFGKDIHKKRQAMDAALDSCSRCLQERRTDSKPTTVLTVLVVVVHCSVYSPVVRYGFRRATDDVILDTMLDPGNGSAANAAGWIANCPSRAKQLLLNSGSSASS